MKNSFGMLSSLSKSRSFFGRWPKEGYHIFFVCDLATFAWSGIREAFGVQWNPRTFQDFFVIVNFLAPGFKQAIWLLFAAQSWALWNIRNKITIEHKLPSHPADCIFKTSLFLQLWRPLLRNKLVDKLDVMLELLRTLYLQSQAYSVPNVLMAI
jgi:hypothetical protein